MPPGQEASPANPYQSPHETPHETASEGPGNSHAEQTAILMQQTCPWVRLMAILGFISVGLMVLIAGVMLAMVVFGGGDVLPMGQAVLMVVMYGVMGILYIFPSMYLYQYASRIGLYLEHKDVESLNHALKAQKSFWKFVGIMMAVILCFYAVALVFGMLAMAIGMAS